MDQRAELAHLHKAEEDISGARARIERQEQLVARLQKDGHSTDTARSLLQTMRDTLSVMEEHRRLILEQLAAMKGER
jgi:predicted outer membrane protein